MLLRWGQKQPAINVAEFQRCEEKVIKLALLATQKVSVASNVKRRHKPDVPADGGSSSLEKHSQTEPAFADRGTL